VFVALAVSRLGTLAIRRMRKRLEGTMNGTGPINLRRTTTIVGILNSSFRLVVWTVVVLLVLGEFGLNLGPLIAGAGILGVALAFGAQSLVRDFLSGFFILLENQFTVGEAVEVTTDVAAMQVTGRVEAVTLRTTSLRGEDGALHVIPNGNVHVVANRSRGQARVTIEVRVPRGEDPFEVRRLLAALCDELRQDPRIAPRLSSGPDVLGVQQLDADTVFLRVTAQTSPSRAEALEEEISRRIEQRFAPISFDVGVGGAPTG
jgi:small conductance mechanosensitive channel